MIEIPSAVEVIDELAGMADFLSIGSNDLVQYMLAVDRTNEHIADLYVACHPAVLRAIKRVTDAAQKHGKPLSICGEMAADPRLTPFLIGIGIETFSLDARLIPKIQAEIGRINSQEAVKFAGKLLSCGRVSEVKALLG
jgi:phosphotransferase system enzyme I (PtsP)